MAQLCGAKCRCSARSLALAAKRGPEAVAELLNRNRCKRAVVPGRNRCHLHGGYCTGPRTAEGLQRSVAAGVAGQKARRASGRGWKPGNRPGAVMGTRTRDRKLLSAAIRIKVTARQERLGFR
jgi:hypothetical protein